MAELGLTKYEARDGQQITLNFETVKKFLVQGKAEFVTRQELMYFMGICKSKGLNPFNRDCYLVKYTQKQGAAIITSIDYFRKRARAQKDCRGWSKGVILLRDSGQGPKEIIKSKGLMLEGDVLLGGWFSAKPAGWDEPFELEVNLSGYIKKKADGSVTQFWSKENQPSQIAKVAESQGLRTVWPDEFNNLYTPEEMGEPDQFKEAEGAVGMPSDEDLKETPGSDVVYEAEVLPEEKTEPVKEETLAEPEKKEKETPPPEEATYDRLKGAIGRLQKKGLKSWVIEYISSVDKWRKSEDPDEQKCWSYFNERWNMVFGAYYDAEGQPGYVYVKPPPEESTEEEEPTGAPFEPPETEEVIEPE